MFSGGVGSWAAAKRVAAQHGTDNLTLLFCDTRNEDADLYRFLPEAARNVGGELVRLCEGRNIWQVFRDERFLGNSRVAPCSKILKRDLANAWLAANCHPGESVLYFGHEWAEAHRVAGERDRRPGWTVEAPLSAAPFLEKADILAWLRREGIEPPRLYAAGFHHNNCGGGCVKAGVGHFAHLLRVLPCVYAEWEREEIGLRSFLGREDVAILRDRSGGETRPLTLSDLRLRIEAGHQYDLFAIGGCGCFTDGAEAA